MDFMVYMARISVLYQDTRTRDQDTIFILIMNE